MPKLLSAFALILIFPFGLPAQESNPAADKFAEYNRLERVSNLMANMATPEKAIETFRKLRRLGNEVLSEPQRSMAEENCLIRLSVLHRVKGELTTSREYLVEALDLIEKRMGSDYTVARSLGLELETIDAVSKLPEEERQRVIAAWQQLRDSAGFIRRRKWDRALEMQTTARDTLATMLGPTNLETLRATSHTLMGRFRLGRHEGLIEEAQKLIADFQQVFNGENAESIEAWGVLYQLYEAEERWEESLAAQMECHRRSLKMFGPGHLQTARIIQHIAGTLTRLDRKHEIIPLLEHDLAQVDYESDLEYQRRINLCYLLCTSHSSLGDLATSAKYGQQALDWIALRNGVSSFDLDLKATCLQYVADYETLQGNSQKAIDLYEQAGEILSRRKIDSADYYISFGETLLAAGEFERAVTVFRKAVEIREGSSAHSYLIPEYGLAMALFETGQDEEALAAIDSAIEQTHSMFAGDSRHLAVRLHSRASMLRALGREDEAATALQESVTISRRRFRTRSASLEQGAMIRMIGDIHTATENLVDLLAEDQPELAFELAIRNRGLVSAVLEIRNEVLSKTDAPGIASIKQRYRQLQNDIARITMDSVEGDLSRKLSIPLAELHLQRQKLTSESANLVNDRVGEVLDRTSPESLQQSIPPGWSVVVLMDSAEFNPNPDHRIRVISTYDAFVLTCSRTGQRSMSLIRLGEGDSIDGAILEYLNQFGPGQRGIEPVESDTVRKNRLVLESGRRVRSMLWDRIMPAFDGNNRVVICADGLTNRVPWNSLAKDDESFLVNQFTICVADHPGDCQRIFRQQRKTVDDNARFNTLLLAGGIEYGQHQSPNPDSPFARSWPTLPETITETSLTSEVWQRAHESAPHVLQGYVSETHVTERLAQSRFLHFGTHGIALDEDPERKAHSIGARHALASSGSLMSSTGIVLSAPSVDRPTEQAWQDGYLTGDEILGFDLRHVELVVLSACNTGHGQIVPSEGTFGIDRAFRISGARATLASLRPVPDQAARKFVVKFYENLWLNRMSKIESLRAAQQAMIEDGEPVIHWGSWVLTGDWN